MEVQVKIEGALELEKALKELGPIPARKLGGKALKAGGEIIADLARVLVPVRTGALEDSITVVMVRATKDSERKAAIGFRPPASRYAHLVEFGTSHSAAQPFIRPAIDAKGEDAIAVIGEQLWAGIAAEATKVK
jgi:phage protein, HK97 gp10 family